MVWVDQGYRGPLGAQVMNTLHIRLHVATRSALRAPSSVRGPISPRRWVVERTFAWLGRYRRLCKDYEFLADSSRAMILAASSCLLLRRLVHSAF
jgi:putative transposase